VRKWYNAGTVLISETEVEGTREKKPRTALVAGKSAVDNVSQEKILAARIFSCETPSLFPCS
jgi:hypothetical protein